MPKLPYKILESSTLYTGHIIRLVKDRFVLDIQKDKIVTRELVVHPGAVVILPFYSADKIVLIKQFRYAAQGDLWEIPAGTREGKEDPFVCAKRELEEETGFKARQWKKLTEFYPAPGITNERMHLYSAKKLYAGKKNLDHDEWIQHKIVSLKEALRMAYSGKIQDAKTLLAILWVAFENKR